MPKEHSSMVRSRHRSRSRLRQLVGAVLAPVAMAALGNTALAEPRAEVRTPVLVETKPRKVTRIDQSPQASALREFDQELQKAAKVKAPSRAVKYHTIATQELRLFKPFAREMARLMMAEAKPFGKGLRIEVIGNDPYAPTLAPGHRLGSLLEREERRQYTVDFHTYRDVNPDASIAEFQMIVNRSRREFWNSVRTIQAHLNAKIAPPKPRRAIRLPINSRESR